MVSRDSRLEALGLNQGVVKKLTVGMLNVNDLFIQGQPFIEYLDQVPRFLFPMPDLFTKEAVTVPPVPSSMPPPVSLVPPSLPSSSVPLPPPASVPPPLPSLPEHMVEGPWHAVTPNAVPVFDTSSGQLLKESAVQIQDQTLVSPVVSTQCLHLKSSESKNLPSDILVVTQGPEQTLQWTAWKDLMSVSATDLLRQTGLQQVRLGGPHDNVCIGTGADTEVVGQQNTSVGMHSQQKLQEGQGNVTLGFQAGAQFVRGDYNTCLGSHSGPHQAEIHDTINLGAFAAAPFSGTMAWGSTECPLHTSTHASSGHLPLLQPAVYLPVFINGVPYKLPLYYA